MDCPQRLEAMRRGIRQPETPAMFEGKLLHSSGLEPDTFEQTYAVCGPRNTKPAKSRPGRSRQPGKSPSLKPNGTKPWGSA